MTFRPILCTTAGPPGPSGVSPWRIRLVRNPPAASWPPGAQLAIVAG